MSKWDIAWNPVAATKLAIESDGKSLLDPIGTVAPNMRGITDPGNLIYKTGGDAKEYVGANAGKTRRRIDRAADANSRAANHARAQAAGYGGVPGLKAGGKVSKAKKASAPKGRRGDGCARKGHTKGKMR